MSLEIEFDNWFCKNEIMDWLYIKSYISENELLEVNDCFSILELIETSKYQEGVILLYNLLVVKNIHWSYLGFIEEFYMEKCQQVAQDIFKYGGVAILNQFLTKQLSNYLKFLQTNNSSQDQFYTIQYSKENSQQADPEKATQMEQEIRFSLTVCYLALLFNQNSMTSEYLDFNQENLLIQLIKLSGNANYLPIKKLIMYLSLYSKVCFQGSSNVQQEDQKIPRLLQNFENNPIEQMYQRLIIQDSTLPQFLVVILKILLETSPDARRIEEIYLEKEWKSITDLQEITKTVIRKSTLPNEHEEKARHRIILSQSIAKLIVL